MFLFLMFLLGHIMSNKSSFLWLTGQTPIAGTACSQWFVTVL